MATRNAYAFNNGIIYSNLNAITSGQQTLRCLFEIVAIAARIDTAHIDFDITAIHRTTERLARDFISYYSEK